MDNKEKAVNLLNRLTIELNDEISDIGKTEIVKQIALFLRNLPNVPISNLVSLLFSVIYNKT
jgi:hypothetical protein